MKKILYMMCGAPASGKTYFAKHTLIKDNSWAYISRDEVRFSIISDNDEYFSKEKQVFRAFTNEINKNLQDDNITYVIADATHLNWASRLKLMKAITEPVDIIPVVIKTDYKTVCEQNNKRTGRAHLPEDALRNMFKRFTDPCDDLYHYPAIMYVDREKKIEPTK